MLKVINHPVHLVKFALGVLVPDGQLITVSFADGAVFICPLIPDVAVEIVDIVGFLLPDPSIQVLKYVRRMVRMGNSRFRS